MSRERLLDLLSALNKSGWQHLSQDDYSRGNDNPFELDSGTLVWGMGSSDHAHVLELEFHAFGDLGQRTESLKDIFYCMEPRSGRRLYFVKRSSDEWPVKVGEFVEALRSISLPIG